MKNKTFKGFVFAIVARSTWGSSDTYGIVVSTTWHQCRMDDYCKNVDFGLPLANLCRKSKGK